jgi:hypothetical protein
MRTLRNRRALRKHARSVGEATAGRVVVLGGQHEVEPGVSVVGLAKFIPGVGAEVGERVLVVDGLDDAIVVTALGLVVINADRLFQEKN